MNDLKKLVLDSTANPSQAAQILKDHAGLFEGLQDDLHKAKEPKVLNIKSGESPMKAKKNFRTSRMRLKRNPFH